RAGVGGKRGRIGSGVTRGDTAKALKRWLRLSPGIERLLGYGSSLPRQFDGDGESMRERRLGAHRATVPLDDLANDREPETRAAAVARNAAARTGRAVEAL